MLLNQQVVISQIDAILDQCIKLVSGAKFDDLSDLSDDRVSEAVNLLFAAIERLAPPNSSYINNAKVYQKALTGILGTAVAPLLGILRALRRDYDAGNLQSIVELVHADIFADFLDMADYLLQQAYKDAAAVVVGSVLESHLRKLCQKHGIPVLQSGTAPKKADALNAELAGSTVYSKLDQKSVTAWLDLRNKAAHGKYTDYTPEQVSLMLQGVRDFVARHAA